ncbi:MAG: hypothetical protein V7L22_30045 [Nostoc sp.]|uniref:hypothetical protein n=1 Tax=Nostoc sp. TaxID=1180 RepID=UPI002FFC9A3C
MLCEGAKTGKVRFKNNGVTRDIIVPVTPFSVSCSITNACGKSGSRTITVNVSNPAASSNNGTQFTFASYSHEECHFTAVPQGGTYDGNRYDLRGTCPGNDRLIVQGASINSGALIVLSNVFTPDNESGLVVKDSNGNTLINVSVSQCDYEVSCGDDCPDGQCKCHSDVYPGYCCNDCASTAAQIHSVTELARSKANG